MTLGQMRYYGVRPIDATCNACQRDRAHSRQHAARPRARRGAYARVLSVRLKERHNPARLAGAQVAGDAPVRLVAIRFAVAVVAILLVLWMIGLLPTPRSRLFSPPRGGICALGRPTVRRGISRRLISAPVPLLHSHATVL
jgi:hypothetical protein